MNIIRDTSKYSSTSEFLCFWAIIGSYYAPAYILKHLANLLNYIDKKSVGLISENK